MEMTKEIASREASLAEQQEFVVFVLFLRLPLLASLSWQGVTRRKLRKLQADIQQQRHELEELEVQVAEGEVTVFSFPPLSLSVSPCLHVFLPHFLLFMADRHG